MTRARPAPTIGAMPDTPNPRGDGRLRLVLDEHERERSALAHELHEEVAQALAAVLLGLDGLSIGDDSERSESKIASMRGLVADTLEHCRALAVALCPPLLDQLGLVPALERLAERAGVEEVSIEPALTAAALGPALETQVYRSVEGALASVRQAHGLRVSLGPAYSDVRISVRPFDSDTPTDTLGPLEARLDLIGGTLGASEREVAIRIPAGSAAGAGIAAFPQPRHVEIPDGRRCQAAVACDQVRRGDRVTTTHAQAAPTAAIRNFAELSRPDVAFAGGKGANLGELRDSGGSS